MTETAHENLDISRIRAIVRLVSMSVVAMLRAEMRAMQKA
jgi:hypothetical protein